MQTKLKEYEVVEKNNPVFNEILDNGWKEIGIDAEYFSNSDQCIVYGDEGEIIGIFEIVTYDKGFENEELENIFPFSNLQNSQRQLIYLDKVVLVPSKRGNSRNLSILVSSIATHAMQIQNGKPQTWISLLRTPFFKVLNKRMGINFIPIGDEVNGETPVFLDFEKERQNILNNPWYCF